MPDITPAAPIRDGVEEAIDALIAAARAQSSDSRHAKVLDLIESILEFQRFTLVACDEWDPDKATRFLAYVEDALNAFKRRAKGMRQWKTTDGAAMFKKAHIALAKAHSAARPDADVGVVFEGANDG